MKIGELALKSGFSTYTLRYYEKIGLLPTADRKSNQRDYDQSTLVWLAFITRLKSTAMPLSEMVVYARLRSKGAPTSAARRALLVLHRQRVRAQIILLQDNLIVLDKKISTYSKQQREVKENANDIRNPL